MYAELDGIPIETNAPAGWRYQPGVKPYIKTVEIDRAAGLQVFEDGTRHGSSITLTVGSVSRTFKGLTILGTGPSQNPGTLRMQVADRRWTWSYSISPKSYNVPRKSPNNRRVIAGFAGSVDLPVDIVSSLREAVDDRDYAEWSLKNGKKWTGREVLEDVLNLVVGEGKWEIDSEAPPMTESVENLVLSGHGDTALSQVFVALGGGLNVWINAEGIAIVYSPQDGSEIEAVGLGGGTTTVTRQQQDDKLRAIQGRPLHELQDNRKVRPSGYEIYYPRLIEARIDFKEGNDEITTTRTSADPIVSPTAFNVFPSPEDGIVPAVGGRAVREIVKGTWLTLADLLALYGNDAKGNLLAADIPLTEAVIEKLWFGNGLNSYAHPAYDKGKVWERRIAVIREHWRRTYQLQRPWIDRIIDMQPFLVALEDGESGARAPALVFQDYTVIFAWDPNLSGITASEQERRLAQSKFSNSTTGQTGGSIVGTDLADLRNAPATVRIMDKDQGIIQISMRDDWTGWADRYERTATVPLGNPTGSYDSRKILMDDEEASSGHEVSLLLSFAMGAPNDLRRFHKVVVTHEQASDLLPTNLRGTKGEGPVLQLQYGAPRAVARFPWRDDKADAFQQLFSQGWQGAFPEIGDPVNQGQLVSIALALASKELSRFADHPEGALVKSFDADAKITGAISAVEFEFEPGPGGGAFTQIELDPSPPPIDPKAIMPDDVRRMIDGFVDP